MRGEDKKTRKKSVERQHFCDIAVALSGIAMMMMINDNDNGWEEDRRKISRAL